MNFSLTSDFLNNILMKQITYLLILLIALNTVAQNKVLNETFSLNGEWEIIYDDQNKGIEQKWFLSDNFKSHDSIKTISVPKLLGRI